MSNESTLHRWALLDKAGKTRNTSTAKTKSNARFAFTEARGGKALPAGWTIVDRGPAEPESPRPFQVGDRVKVLTCRPNNVFREGETGKLVRDAGDHQPYLVEFVDGITWWYYRGEIAITEPAPQPKAEDPGRVQFLESELEDARAEIATLKAEVERLNHSLIDTRSEMTENYHQFSQARDRAEAAEAKLDDIKAIIRTFKILNDLPGEPGFTDAVNAVLDGAA